MIKVNYDWNQMLYEFRQLGGIAENVSIARGASGNGLYPINPEKPVRIRVPQGLLFDTKDFVLVGDDLVLSEGIEVSTKVRDYINNYQKHFSWGADGYLSVQKFEQGLTGFPTELLIQLKKYGIIDLNRRHLGTWDDVIKRQFLKTREIRFQSRRVLMPVMDLLNHSPNSGNFSVDDAINFYGKFSNEITVNYSSQSDSMRRFFTYGFACREPQIYSVACSIKIAGYGEVVIKYNPADLKRSKNLIFPTVETKGTTTTLSYLVIGDRKIPGLPRSILRDILREFPESSIDEIYDRVRSGNLLIYKNLLEASLHASEPVISEFKKAILYQLEALAASYGSHPVI